MKFWVINTQDNHHFLLTVACGIAGILLLVLDFNYPFFIGSGVLYVLLLSIIINTRSYFTILFLTFFYLILLLLGYYFYTENLVHNDSMLMLNLDPSIFSTIVKSKMLVVRIIGVFAILFTTMMGYFQLKKSQILEDEQRKLSIIDFLTGAYSRRFLFENIKQRFSDSERFPDYNFSIIMFDIDNFKKINDIYSHMGGDVALKSIVDCAKKTIRNVDIIGRFGGEEFIIVSPNSNMEGAMLLAERLRKNIESLSIVFGGKKIPVTISAGVSDYRSFVYNSVKEMEYAVDQALYRAKEKGRNRIEAVEFNTDNKPLYHKK